MIQSNNFQLLAFNAKSKIFHIDDSIKKSDLILIYDYIDPRLMDMYEFINVTISQ